MKNGILLIDKPSGMTSHGVISKLRKKLQIKKIGHAGTLDPSATGLLILCIGKATKISSFLLDANKGYQADLCFGKVTTTYDSEGEVTAEKDASHISEKDLLNILPQFLGAQSQKPPIFSAIKIQGKKLYQYARQQIDVEIPLRSVSIDSIKLLSFSNPDATIEVACTKGTYIRSLVHDLGQVLGVGAYVKVIRRIQSGSFGIDQAVSLSALLEMNIEDIETHIIPIGSVLAKSFHTIEVSKEDEELILRGVEYSKQKLKIPLSPESLILFVSQENRKELAIGQWGEKEKISFKRVF